ncbi:MAG TPA: helix-turn-helix domain-containing protein [Spirochaetota bacterium]|nr:helix-turn-helix domain-containing protein [Spirochaetota bacterium]
MGNKLSFLRRTKGIKQYDLARKLEVSPSFLCKIEKGLLEPTDLFKNKCADFFNEKVESIFSLPEDKKRIILAGDELTNNLWTVRLKKNLKQNKLAELIGCSPSYLSKIEKGFQEPNGAFKKKCAKILKIKETELFPENKPVQ